MLIMPACRLAKTKQSTEPLSFKGEVMMMTSDGKAYSKIERLVTFNFSSDKVSYLFPVEDKILKKDFDVSLAEVSKDKCIHYYAKDINNLFILDQNRGTLQVIGSNKNGKGRQNFSGHTFIGMVPVKMDQITRGVEEIKK